MHRNLTFFLLITFLFLSCPSDNNDDNKDNVEKSIIDFNNVNYGTQVEILDDFAGMMHTGYSSNIDREYKMLGEDMNVIWVQADFSWSSIQPDNETQWNFDGSIGNRRNFDSYVQRANSENKKVMGMLLYDVNWVHDKFGFDRERRIRIEQIPDFVNYAVETVKRYNGKNGYGKVDVWFIWNEPDLYPRFWTGTQEEFFALNKAAAEAIRALDATEGTHTLLVSGIFTSLVSDAWISGLFENGGMELVDGIGYHPYSPSPQGTLNFYNFFREKVKLADKTGKNFADRIWINEMGYPTYLEKGQIPQGRYMTDQYEGDMPEVVTKTFTLLAAVGARNLTWYHFFDGRGVDENGQDTRRNNDSEDWFGLVWRKTADEWILKGGYWGYALCSWHIPGKNFKSTTFPNLSEDISHYYFEGNGKHTLIAWNNNPLLSYDLTFKLPGSNHKIWNVETGISTNKSKNFTQKLLPYNTYQKTLIFITWDD